METTAFQKLYTKVNPVRRKRPSGLIATGIPGVDLNNTLVIKQKTPFFADPDQPCNQVMAMVALCSKADKIIEIRILER